jgi:hypothetical protein
MSYDSYEEMVAEIAIIEPEPFFCIGCETNEPEAGRGSLPALPRRAQRKILRAPLRHRFTGERAPAASG